jgi:hypothetical protein
MVRPPNRRPAAHQRRQLTGYPSLRSRRRKWSIRPDCHHILKADMLIRAILLLVILILGNSPLLAAPECPASITPPKAPDQIVDWYDKYIGPSRALTGLPEIPRPTRSVVEALIEKTAAFHRRGVSDPLFFESLVQQIAASYANDGDFKGLTSAAAQKIYRAGSGSDLDFSALCIDTRRSRFPEDTFAITLFGVNFDNCQHVTGRGLIFTSTMINGSANGECRPDHNFFRMLIVPVFAGTNTVTFVCSKDVGGCAGR